MFSQPPLRSPCTIDAPIPPGTSRSQCLSLAGSEGAASCRRWSPLPRPPRAPSRHIQARLSGGRELAAPAEVARRCVPRCSASWEGRGGRDEDSVLGCNEGPNEGSRRRSGILTTAQMGFGRRNGITSIREARRKSAVRSWHEAAGQRFLPPKETGIGTK
jgi:hypothetical protein